MTNDIEVYTKQYVCYKIQNISWYQKYAAYAGVKKAPWEAVLISLAITRQWVSKTAPW